MKIQQMLKSNGREWKVEYDNLQGEIPKLVLVFGSRQQLTNESQFVEIRNLYPETDIVLASTGGEIANAEAYDNSITTVALAFEKTQIQCRDINISSPEESYKKAKEVAEKFETKALKHLFILSDGLKVNGSALVQGIRDVVGDTVIITGGLAGDGVEFRETVVGHNAVPASGKIVIIGFYGDNLQVTHGSLGGWKPFGPERLITKAVNNVLYELDNKPALSLYKNYLGEEAKNLPSSALLFPLSIRKSTEDKNIVVRTILSVDEQNQSMTFAGTIPQGYYARLMQAGFDDLISGAEEAARQSKAHQASGDNLAILVSCIGRKLLMGQRVSYEIEPIRKVFGERTVITGFYSYGEISPQHETGICDLHNQTMTITTISEN